MKLGKKSNVSLHLNVFTKGGVSALRNFIRKFDPALSYLNTADATSTSQKGFQIQIRSGTKWHRPFTCPVCMSATRRQDERASFFLCSFLMTLFTKRDLLSLEISTRTQALELRSLGNAAEQERLFL